LSDWIVYRGAGLTRTSSPCVEDNLDSPMGDEPRERDGWGRPGWPGVTFLRDAARGLPVEIVLGAAAMGFGQGRVHRWLRARDPLAPNADLSADREQAIQIGEVSADVGRAANGGGATVGAGRKPARSSDGVRAVGELSRAIGKSRLGVPPPTESGA
jgi:hypothetical protein